MPVGNFILVVYLLAPPACNFAKIWIPYQIRIQFSDCFWLVKRTDLWSKQNISFASNGDWKKKNHSPANTSVARLTFAEWRSAFNFLFVKLTLVTWTSLWRYRSSSFTMVFFGTVFNVIPCPNPQNFLEV